MNSNIEFLKNIINKDSLKEYLEIEELEQNVLNSENITNLQLYKLTIVKEQLLKNLLYTIKKEQTELFLDRLRLSYNVFSYKINATIKNEDLEKITKQLRLVDKIIDICLLKLNYILKKMQKTKHNDELLTIYLYLLAITNLKNECNKFYSQQIEIYNTKLRNINAEFYNNIDIEYTLTNIEKVKALILTFN